MKNRSIVAIFVFLTTAVVGCWSRGSWIGTHSYRKSLAGSNADYEMGSARFSVTATDDRRIFTVTDLNSRCSMNLVADGQKLRGSDVPCRFASDSVLKGGMVRIYRQILFDFDQGSVVGLVVNRMAGEPDDVFLEDDFNPKVRTKIDRRRFTGLLSNTAQTSDATAECLGGTADRSSEMTIVVESEGTVLFPGFRCRIAVERREVGLLSASSGTCVAVGEGPSLTEIGIKERVLTSFEYNSKTGEIKYSARTTGRLRGSPDPARIGTWCSRFSGRSMASQ